MEFICIYIYVKITICHVVSCLKCAAVYHIDDSLRRVLSLLESSACFLIKKKNNTLSIR